MFVHTCCFVSNRRTDRAIIYTFTADFCIIGTFDSHFLGKRNLSGSEPTGQWSYERENEIEK